MEEQAYLPGSVEDFERLYRQSYRKILYTLYGVLGNLAEAEDCTQEAFTKAFGVWNDWRPDAPAEAWLHRIALNVAYSHRRHEKLREVGEVIRRIGRPRQGDPVEVAQHDELLKALRQLPPDQAAVIILRHHHGYTNREIAIALEAPESTIASRLAAAKRSLRRRLAWDERVVTLPVQGVVPVETPVRDQ